MRAWAVVVEIVGTQQQGDFVARLGQQQQAAEHGLFRLEAARRLAIEQFADALRAAGTRLVFYRGHRMSIRLLTSVTQYLRVRASLVSDVLRRERTLRVRARCSPYASPRIPSFSRS